MSGRCHALSLHDIVAGIETAHPNPLFDMIDRYAEKDEAIAATQIALEQEAGFVAQQPAGFVHSSANLDHLG